MSESCFWPVVRTCSTFPLSCEKLHQSVLICFLGCILLYMFHIQEKKIRTSEILPMVYWNCTQKQAQNAAWQWGVWRKEWEKALWALWWGEKVFQESPDPWRRKYPHCSWRELHTGAGGHALKDLWLLESPCGSRFVLEDCSTWTRLTLEQGKSVWRKEW